MNRTPLRVVIPGQGYVGLPVAMRAVAVGHQVVGHDIDLDRVKRLAAADSFVEDVDTEVLRAAPDAGSIRVLAADPLADPALPLPISVQRVTADATTIATADAVVSVTDHTDFDPETIVARAAYVLDTRRHLEGTNVEAL